MNTHPVSSNTYSEDKYTHYSEVCHSAERSIVPERNTHVNFKDIQGQTNTIKKFETDHINPSLNGCDISERLLNLAKLISKKTAEFKAEYYEEAFKIKDNQSKRPTIKDFIKVAEGLKYDGKAVDEMMIRANKTDCSGFIRMIYEESGKSLLLIMQREQKKLADMYGLNSEEFKSYSRGAELIRRAAKPVTVDEVRPGDLVFFKEIKSLKRDRIKDTPPDVELTDYATHIGIVSKVDIDGDGKRQISFIHKSTHGGVVESLLNSNARTTSKIYYSDLNPSFGRIK
ncbi:MAG: C40 family peptidase [Deltaproteobacteria bacterium]|nr:C40 family peptidase [Deltaproteobacteria bacterium]